MLSVIVPVYKTEKYLRRCVDSILNQTYTELEIILVDDGSPDNSPYICDQYRKEDPRIVVIHQKNAGVAAARNAGLDRASGEYVTFVDSDDYIDHNMYFSMMQIMKKCNCDVVMCDCKKEFLSCTELYTHNIRSGFYSKEQLEKEYFPHLLIMENMEYPATISNWLMLYKKTVHLSGIRYEEGIRYSEDWLFGSKLLYQANSFYYMKGQGLYHYFMNVESVTHRFNPDKWADYEILYFKIKEYFSKCKDFDFSAQIYKVLLFLIYDVVGEILSADQWKSFEKIKRAKEILSRNYVQDMFSKIRISALQISIKLKILTYMYKKRKGLWLFIQIKALKRRNK